MLSTLQEFSQKFLEAESLFQQNHFEKAEAICEKLLQLPLDPFRYAYVLDLCAEAKISRQHWEESTQLFERALGYAEEIAWEDLRLQFHHRLAEIFQHRAEYPQAQYHFEQALIIAQNRGDFGLWIELYQNLGQSFFQQARYREALSVFRECEQAFEDHQDDFSHAAVGFSIARVQSALGLAQAARTKMSQVESALSASNLKPYFAFLRGKIAYASGDISPALTYYREAAKSFEDFGDLSGKVEVLLAMSAPLLELDLIYEAQKVMDLMLQWEELKNFPALEHAVRLRRLALAAFSGKSEGLDLELLHGQEKKLGRLEDWLQFWFHLALASQRVRNAPLRDFFLQKAKALVETIRFHLKDGELEESFLRRSDIARILRLADAELTREEPAVQALRDFEGDVDAASFGPPRRS